MKEEESGYIEAVENKDAVRGIYSSIGENIKETGNEACWKLIGHFPHVKTASIMILLSVFCCIPLFSFIYITLDFNGFWRFQNCLRQSQYIFYFLNGTDVRL